jgi:hypothetical protein
LSRTAYKLVLNRFFINKNRFFAIIESIWIDSLISESKSSLAVPADSRSPDMGTAPTSLMRWLGSGRENSLQFGVSSAADLRVLPWLGITPSDVRFGGGLILDWTGILFDAMCGCSFGLWLGWTRVTFANKRHSDAREHWAGLFWIPLGGVWVSSLCCVSRPLLIEVQDLLGYVFFEVMTVDYAGAFYSYCNVRVIHGTDGHRGTWHSRNGWWRRLPTNEPCPSPSPTVWPIFFKPIIKSC